MASLGGRYQPRRDRTSLFFRCTPRRVISLLTGVKLAFGLKAGPNDGATFTITAPLDSFSHGSNGVERSASRHRSTGGLLNSETEEKYAITWTSKTEQAFELPTVGAALMNSGENLMYFARKEQCLALGTQLRTKFKPRIGTTRSTGSTPAATPSSCIPRMVFSRR